MVALWSWEPQPVHLSSFPFWYSLYPASQLGFLTLLVHLWLFSGFCHELSFLICTLRTMDVVFICDRETECPVQKYTVSLQTDLQTCAYSKTNILHQNDTGRRMVFINLLNPSDIDWIMVTVTHYQLMICLFQQLLRPLKSKHRLFFFTSLTPTVFGI